MGGEGAVRRPDLVEADHCAAYEERVRAMGVPVPAVVRAADGALFADVGGAMVRVFEWWDLEERSADLDPVMIGRLVGAIHQVVVTAPDAVNPVHPWYTDPVRAAGWDELVDAVTAASAPFAATLASYRDELVALEELLTWPPTLQVCHRDLWADNILAVTGAGPAEVCVIDWENAGLADVSQELALVLFEFGRGSAPRARALWRAYEATGAAGRIDGPRSFSMVVAQLGHIGQDACRQWLEAVDTPARRRAEDRVEEFLGPERLDRATVDALVRAVS